MINVPLLQLKEVGLKSAIIPKFPGVTSALGCLVADVLYDRVQTVNKFLNGVDANDLAKIMQLYLNKGHYGDELYFSKEIQTYSPFVYLYLNKNVRFLY